MVGGCHRSQVDEPVYRNGFRFEILRVRSWENVNGLGDRDHRLDIWSMMEDVGSRRVVTFAHALKLETVLDQDGRDRQAIAVQPRGTITVQESNSFPGLATQRQLDYRGYRYFPSGWVFGLSESPTRISVLKGYVWVLEATQFSTQELPLATTDDWVVVADGLKLRIDNVEQKDNVLNIRWRTYTRLPDTPIQFEYYQRWYRLQFLDPAGNDVPVTGPGTGYDSSGFVNHEVDLHTDEDASKITLRHTVVGRLETYEIPFKYYDVPVDYESPNTPPPPPDDRPRKMPNSDQPTAPSGRSSH